MPAQMPTMDRGASIKSNKFVVLENCLLLSKLNPRFPRVWLPAPHSGRRAIASTELLVLLPSRVATREYLYQLCLSAPFMEAFASRVTGTSSSHQRVKPEDLLSIDVAFPPEPIIKAFTERIRPLLRRIQTNRQEELTLAAIRDTLLTKLLCGEIKVKKTEQLVKAAI